MATVFDVPAGAFIEKVTEQLKASGKVVPPEWAPFVRTGLHTENAPAQPDWWPRRVAAVLRKVYLLGPIGTERLSAEFGGRRDAGSAPYHPRKGSRAVVRGALHQLEALGYISQAEKRGRKVTPQGRKFLDHLAHQLLLELAVKNPELTKYARAR